MEFQTGSSVFFQHLLISLFSCTERCIFIHGLLKIVSTSLVFSTFGVYGLLFSFFIVLFILCAFLELSFFPYYVYVTSSSWSVLFQPFLQKPGLSLPFWYLVTCVVHFAYAAFFLLSAFQTPLSVFQHNNSFRKMFRPLITYRTTSPFFPNISFCFSHSILISVLLSPLVHCCISNCNHCNYIKN